MDIVDKKIFNELQNNAKQNTKEIATKIGLSVTPTYERIKRLEKTRVIKQYVALIDREIIGKQIIAYCQITLFKHQKSLIDDFKEKLFNLSEVMECHHVSGNFDFLIKVAVNDMNSFQVFINEKLSVVEGISTIHSSFVLDSFKETTAYPL
ncbi:Lrp/AsnC family leucine-responsive transcriptional regulator/Lrp/AsnC family transcriptional regulator [Tenacibaculum skagerrakense]|uniref:Lrp/AsnC family leucine-responsive transcriptional regulator/Lrp/AsnC family transcriptional regulator n=1 Tax=Tenacibaculum skagerrakense TaxID=186571 RepID=A0A4R2NNV6_9FLAO|nr:Lrp/AsnC family transcriptional regulator [Tenacibaculum skagerrakense]TCP22965.1 Lrp/AsnC family leucine-responsive transcriptional regulator/Lrp/AsnC family transcriptional regulator [Tenacibaculum skagerrakense]